MPDKSSSRSMVRSISKQLTKIASSTSNSDETKISVDVPLNSKLKSKTASKPGTNTSSGNKKVSPAPTTVIGNKDLRLKVTHNDAGRVVISLSNPDRVLVQVHVDESVLKSKGGVLKKKSNHKDRPKKKSSTVAKSAKKVSSTSTATGTTLKKKKQAKSEPRDLPDEQSSIRGGDRSKSRRGETSSRKPTATTHFSSMASVASSHCSNHSDDSTRSPLDLNRAVAPKTPRVQKGLLPHGDTPSTEPDMEDSTPTWDMRRQKMLKRQNSKLMVDPVSAPTGSPSDDNNTAALHDLMDTGTEAKMEETAEDFSVFSSPLQQRRLQHRQKRLDRQRTETETFRSTRSIRSGGSSRNNLKPLDPPSIEFDASTNATPTSFPPIVPENKRRASINRATHIRHTPHEDPVDDDVSATSNNRRIRKTIDQVRKVELTNKGDHRSGRSSFRSKNDGMNENLLGGETITSKTGSNLFTKIRDKVRSNKRPRKDHQKLSG